MTYEQGVRIASRTFVAYLLFWVVDDATLLPRQILSFATLVQESSSGLSFLSAFKASYSVRIEVLYLSENILRIALWLIAAGWFYRLDPRILKFFGPADPEEPQAQTTP